jgi:UDP-glucose 6-dehydrogenase
MDPSRLHRDRQPRSCGLRWGLAREVTSVSPEVLFLCVPTPIGVGGSADLSVLEAVLKKIRSVLAQRCVVVIKSTVTVGTALIERDNIGVVRNPQLPSSGSSQDRDVRPAVN